MNTFPAIIFLFNQKSHTIGLTDYGLDFTPFVILILDVS